MGKTSLMSSGSHATAPRLCQVAHGPMRARTCAFAINDRPAATADVDIDLTTPSRDLRARAHVGKQPDCRIRTGLLAAGLLRRHQYVASASGSERRAEECLTVGQAFAGSSGPSRLAADARWPLQRSPGEHLGCAVRRLQTLQGLPYRTAGQTLGACRAVDAKPVRNIPGYRVSAHGWASLGTCA